MSAQREEQAVESTPSGPAGEVRRRASGLLQDGAPDRFRAGYPRLLGLGILLSVAVHLVLLSVGPDVRMDSVTRDLQALEVVRLPPPVVTPPEVEVPERPEPIRRPSAPVVGPDLAEAPDEPVFIPHDVRPRLLNRSEVQDFLLGFYPPTLRAIGVEGQVMLWLYLNEEGRVLKSQVRRSSGIVAFDELAHTVAGLMEFRPALNHGQPTPVWVEQPIRFDIQQPSAPGELAGAVGADREPDDRRQ